MLQPTPFCNIACDYCYLAERDTRRRMSLEVVEAAVENVRASGMLGASLGVVWHAGEPFAVPRTFYEAAFATVEKRIPCSVALSHSIQTNGTPIDDRWAALFPRRGLRVGVSLDGRASCTTRTAGRGTASPRTSASCAASTPCGATGSPSTQSRS